MSKDLEKAREKLAEGIYEELRECGVVDNDAWEDRNSEDKKFWVDVCQEALRHTSFTQGRHHYHIGLIQDDAELPEIRIDSISRDIREYIGKLYGYYQVGQLETEIYKDLVKSSGIIDADIEHHMYKAAQQDMLSAGFRKVIEE